MKKYFYLFVILGIVGCSKEVEFPTSNFNDHLHIHTYAAELVVDSSFADLVGAFILSRQSIIDLNQHVIQDSSETIKLHDNFNAALIRFITTHPTFLALTSNNRLLVLQEIQTLLRDKNFVVVNKRKINYLLSQNDIVNNYLLKNRNNSFYVQSNAENVLVTNTFTNTEILECALNVLTNVVGSYSNLLDDLRVLTKGLTGVNLFKTAMDFVVANSPWYKTASVVISLGLCIYTAID